jgi:hypothetical protein
MRHSQALLSNFLVGYVRSDEVLLWKFSVVTKLSAEEVIPADALLISNQAVVGPPRAERVVNCRKLRVVEWFGVKVAIKASHHEDVHQNSVGASGF